MLTRALAAQVAHVIGIDTDADSIARARERCRDLDNVDFVTADFLAHDFPAESFDVVVAVASLHHMPFAAALERMRRILRPGGFVGVIGLGRSGSPVDLACDAAGALLHRVYLCRHGEPTQDAPVKDPALTYGQVRRVTAEQLPGRRFSRRLLFRYSLFWTDPRQ